jgi:type I restriction enzyme, S subunit
MSVIVPVQAKTRPSVSCKETEVGPIPEDWDVLNIGDLEPFVTSGSRGWAKYYSDRGVPFLRITNMSRDTIYLALSDLKLVELPPRQSEAERTQLRVGDVLISITADIGIIGYVDSRVPLPAYINQHIALVRFDLEGVDAKFISYFLASERPRELFRSLTDQGAKAGMSLITVRKIALAHPRLEEQQAIATALSDVDALIEALEKLVAKKRTIKLAAMQQLLTGVRRLKGFEALRLREVEGAGQIPTDWDVRELRNAALMHGRIGWQGLKEAEFTSNPEDPFLITGMNFKDGEIRWDEVYHVPLARYAMAPQIQLRPGDVLMTKDGTIGKLLFVRSIPYPGLATLNSHLLVFRPKNNAFDPLFLYYQLQSKRFANHVELEKSGSTFFGLTQAATGKYVAILPSLEEQRAIAGALSDMDSEIAALESQCDKTKAIKQGMMQQLLTGRTRLV